MWDKIKELVKPFAPVLATALSLTGPIGAGAAIALKSVLTGNEEATEQEVYQALQSMTPEQKLALQKVDNDFKLQMRELDIKEISLDQQDRSSAREREVKLAESGHKDWIPAILAIGFLIIYAVIQVYTIYNPGGSDDIISARVQDIVIMIISYYFGSSSSSRKKDKVIENMKR